MTDYYCAWCGKKDPKQPCDACGCVGKTDVQPSQEPCAYCGARPTWPVFWNDDLRIWLCSACDTSETLEMTKDDGPS